MLRKMQSNASEKIIAEFLVEKRKRRQILAGKKVGTTNRRFSLAAVASPKMENGQSRQTRSNTTGCLERHVLKSKKSFWKKKTCHLALPILDQRAEAALSLWSLRLPEQRRNRRPPWAVSVGQTRSNTTGCLERHVLKGKKNAENTVKHHRVSRASGKKKTCHLALPFFEAWESSRLARGVRINNTQLDQGLQRTCVTGEAAAGTATSNCRPHRPHRPSSLVAVEP